MLPGEAAAEHVVGVCHHLDTDALEIGVQRPGRQEHGLTGLELEAVEVERCCNTAVGAVLLTEASHPLVARSRPGVPRAKERGLGQLGLVRAHERGEKAPQ